MLVYLLESFLSSKNSCIGIRVSSEKKTKSFRDNFVFFAGKKLFTKIFAFCILFACEKYENFSFFAKLHFNLFFKNMQNFRKVKNAKILRKKGMRRFREKRKRKFREKNVLDARKFIKKYIMLGIQYVYFREISLRFRIFCFIPFHEKNEKFREKFANTNGYFLIFSRNVIGIFLVPVSKLSTIKIFCLIFSFGYPCWVWTNESSLIDCSTKLQNSRLLIGLQFKYFPGY